MPEFYGKIEGKLDHRELQQSRIPGQVRVRLKVEEEQIMRLSEAVEGTGLGRIRFGSRERYERIGLDLEKLPVEASEKLMETSIIRGMPEDMVEPEVREMIHSLGVARKVVCVNKTIEWRPVRKATFHVGVRGLNKDWERYKEGGGDFYDGIEIRKENVGIRKRVPARYTEVTRDGMGRTRAQGEVVGGVVTEERV